MKVFFSRCARLRGSCRAPCQGCYKATDNMQQEVQGLGPTQQPLGLQTPSPKKPLPMLEQRQVAQTNLYRPCAKKYKIKPKDLG